MSKTGIFAVAIVLGLAGAANAAQTGAYEIYNYGSGAGMRFGDAPQVVAVDKNGQVDYEPNTAGHVTGGAFGGGNCLCGAGGCGICIDWKLIGWYGTWDWGHGKEYQYGWCNNCGQY